MQLDLYLVRVGKQLNRLIIYGCLVLLDQPLWVLSYPVFKTWTQFHAGVFSPGLPMTARAAPLYTEFFLSSVVKLDFPRHDFALG